MNSLTSAYKQKKPDEQEASAYKAEIFEKAQLDSKENGVVSTNTSSNSAQKVDKNPGFAIPEADLNLEINLAEDSHVEAVKPLSFLDEASEQSLIAQVQDQNGFTDLDGTKELAIENIKEGENQEEEEQQAQNSLTAVEIEAAPNNNNLPHIEALLTNRACLDALLESLEEEDVFRVGCCPLIYHGDNGEEEKEFKEIMFTYFKVSDSSIIFIPPGTLIIKLFSDQRVNGLTEKIEKWDLMLTRFSKDAETGLLTISHECKEMFRLINLEETQ